MYLDALRVLACVFIIVLHLSAQKFDKVEIGSFEWNVFNVYDSISRWAVPVFIMISGALFLDPKREIRTADLFRKYILRIVFAFVFWSGLYSVVDYLRGTRLRDVAGSFVTGHTHLWFLYMIAGLYLIVPLLRKLTESEKTTRYFLILWFLISVVYPTCRNIVYPFAPRIVPWFDQAINISHLEFISGFSGYFVLGYVLSTKELSKKIRITSYVLGTAGFAATVALTYVYSKRNGVRCDYFYETLSVNSFCMASGIFVFAKYHMPELKNGVVRKCLLLLSECTFGIYLSHLLVMELLKTEIGLHTLKINPIISVPGLTGVIFIICFVISFVLNRIPVIKKYLV